MPVELLKNPCLAIVRHEGGDRTKPVYCDRDALPGEDYCDQEH